MSKICQITGKKAMVGNNVSHSKRRTKRTFDVNLFTKKFYYVEQDCWISLKISAAGLRMINKVGLDAALTQAVEKGYCDWRILKSSVKQTKGEPSYGKESKRKQSAGYPGVHRAQGQWNARHKPLHHHQEPQEHSRTSGVEEVQSHSEEDDHS